MSYLPSLFLLLPCFKCYFSASVYVDARGLTGSPNNSVSLQQRYAAMPTSSAVWASNYPHLVNLLQGTDGEEGGTKNDLL